MSLEFYDITQIAHSDFFFPPEIAIYSLTVKWFVVCRYIEGVAAFGEEGSDVTNTVSRDVEDGAVFREGVDTETQRSRFLGRMFLEGPFLGT